MAAIQILAKPVAVHVPHELTSSGELENKSVDEKIETVIDHLNDHPFVQSEPTQARQVAQFRVRLLEL